MLIFSVKTLLLKEAIFLHWDHSYMNSFFLILEIFLISGPKAHCSDSYRSNQLTSLSSLSPVYSQSDTKHVASKLKWDPYYQQNDFLSKFIVLHYWLHILQNYFLLFLYM